MVFSNLVQMSVEEEQECIEDLRQAATLLAAVPSFTTGMKGRSFGVFMWPRDGEQTVAVLDALQPLAPCLTGLIMKGALFTPTTVAAMGRVLGNCTHTVCGIDLLLHHGSSSWHHGLNWQWYTPIMTVYTQ